MTTGPARPPTRRAGRAIALLLVVAAVAIAAALPGVHSALIDLLESARSVIAGRPVAGAALFVVLGALSAMLAFFSSAILVPVGIRAWGPVGCGLLLWTGWLLGGAVSYSVARWLGRPVIRRVVPDRRVTEYEHLITERASFGMVVLFQLALPSEIPGYVLGLARYPAGRYLAALALVELPYAAGVVLMGESFLDRKVLPLVGLGLLAALVALTATRRLRRRRASL